MSFDWETYRDNLVSDRIKFLMSEGQEYYPFEPKNFTEALQNLDDSQMSRLNTVSANAADAADEQYNPGQYNPVDEYIDNAAAGECLLYVITQYWRSIATNSAERQIQSTEELEFEARRK